MTDKRTTSSSEHHLSRRSFFAVSSTAAIGFSALVAGQAGAAPSLDLQVGRGIGDMTGEPYGAGMNGYAVIAQTSTGIHLRQRARAFIFVDPASSKRVVHVTCEIGLMFESILLEVLKRLKVKYGSLYTIDNVLLTATHTHSAPGGTDSHLLVDITTFGFRPVTFNANVSGIVDAISRAHADIAPSQVSATAGLLQNAGVNRSAKSFDRDPAADKAQFPGKFDPRTANLQITRNGQLVGVLNWFATHGTSMKATNTLSSSDNKGYAALHWEREVAGVDYTTKTAKIVTAFAQSTPGDITPNLNLKPGSGPTEDEFENTRIIGLRQYDAANNQVNQSPVAIQPGIDMRMVYVNFSSVSIRPEFTFDGKPHTTAQAALGASFAASSQEDGGGIPELGLNEGGNGDNPAYVKVVTYAIPQSLRDAHAPKDVVLPVGAVDGIVQQIVPFHIVRLGNFYIFACPFEPTIVAGARLRKAIAQTLGIDISLLIVQGYTNAYAHYMTTYEEYQEQDYEGGATMFGPHQLAACTQVAVDLATALKNGTAVTFGTDTRDKTGLVPNTVSGNPPATDQPQPFKKFGDVLTAPAAKYTRGTQASVKFCGAQPNSNLRRDDTYLGVERFANASWARVYDDGDWSTKIYFKNDNNTTDVTITWDIPANQAPGTYRIRYYGDSKALIGTLTPFQGTSPQFTVA